MTDKKTVWFPGAKKMDGDGENQRRGKVGLYKCSIYLLLALSVFRLIQKLSF